MAKIENSFYQKIRFKYKLSVLNENTLEEVWHVRLSKLNVFLASFFVAIIYFFLIALLIIKTPMRSFLPGYTENLNLRKQVMLDAVRVDSISETMREQHQYISVLRRVMTGEISTDSSSTVGSLLPKENTKINVDKSEKEANFCSEYEETEKYNVAAIDNNRQTDVDYLMHRPAIGIIDSKFDDKNKYFGISIRTNPLSNVYSILDGVVIFASFSVEDNLFVMQIQHMDDFISVYKIKQPFLRKVGDNIHAGEILATFTSKNVDPDLVFQVWRRGKPLNPENYIAF